MSTQQCYFCFCLTAMQSALLQCWNQYDQPGLPLQLLMYCLYSAPSNCTVELDSPTCWCRLLRSHSSSFSRSWSTKAQTGGYSLCMAGGLPMMISHSSSHNSAGAPAQFCHATSGAPVCRCHATSCSTGHHQGASPSCTVSARCVEYSFTEMLLEHSLHAIGLNLAGQDRNTYTRGQFLWLLRCSLLRLVGCCCWDRLAWSSCRGETQRMEVTQAQLETLAQVSHKEHPTIKLVEAVPLQLTSC